MGSFADSDQAAWEDMISANLLTAFVACRAVLPTMAAPSGVEFSVDVDPFNMM